LGIIVLLIFTISSNSFGDNQWINIGPEGESVQTLAINPQAPDTLYAGTWGDGVFKTTNGGMNWTAINTGMTATIVYALAINPQTPDTLYAGTTDGVFKTTNGGTDWTASNTGLTDFFVDVLALTINPQTPETLYAGTWWIGCVFKSTNGGTDWTAINTGLTDFFVDVLALTINPQTPGTLYAGTWGDGVFKTTNGGTDWMNTGLTNTTVRALAINPQAPETLYAGTWGDGVFKTTNGGMNWTAINTGMTGTIVYALAINPQAPETLYAGTTDGVFKTTNGGTDWTAINTGLTDFFVDVLALAINPQAPDTLYAGTYGSGVFKIQQEAEPINPTLTLLKSGTGSGTVTSSPGGINCGNDCTEVYTPDTKVTLTAKADTNSTFTGWSGGGCSGTEKCIVTMNTDTLVTATFAAKTPDISVSPNSLDFESVKSGKKVTKTLKITNNGLGNLVITVSGLEGTDFSIQGSSSVTIKAKKSYSLKVLCTPTSGGLKTATLEIDSNDPDTPTLEISLTAALPATTPDISVAQTPIEFGSIKVGKKVTKTLKITNNGTGDLVITLSGLEETDFSIQGSSSVTIKAKKSYSLKVLFTPTSAELKTATLEITSNDPDTPTIDISLSGAGQ